MDRYLLVLVILAVLSYVYLRLAVKFKIIDKPNKRSSHKKITVRGGGILFPIAVTLFFLLNDFQYPFFFTGVIAISVISFLDDIYTLSSKIRFPFQVLAIYLILHQVGLPFHPILLYSFAFFMGVGFINMFNFMDGINGITGLYSLSVLLGLFLINSNEHIVNQELIVYIFLSLLVFGFYNFRKKAVFFAGDIGSISIGMVLFFIGLYLSFTLESPLIILFIIVYGADAGNTLIYRKFFTKESILDPHRHHIYQKLIDRKKMPHLQVSMLYAAIQLAVNILIYNTYHLELQLQFMVFAALVVVFMFLYYYMFFKLKV